MAPMLLKYERCQGVSARPPATASAARWLLCQRRACVVWVTALASTRSVGQQTESRPASLAVVTDARATGETPRTHRTFSTTAALSCSIQDVHASGGASQPSAAGTGTALRPARPGNRPL